MVNRTRSGAMDRLALISVCIVCSFFVPVGSARSQEKVRLAYSSTDTTNQIWTVAYDAGFLHTEQPRCGSHLHRQFHGRGLRDCRAGCAGRKRAGSAVANAAVRGADTVSAGCVINILAYELAMRWITSGPEDLRGKSIGISRFGSVSDVAARELLKGLGLRPMDDVKILQIGGASERAAGFSRGVIAGFPLAAGKREPDPRRTAAPDFGKHGGSAEALSPAVYLRRYNQKLCGEKNATSSKRC